ncbi:DUF1611 domain-containing protein [Reichenbachiella sp. MALMAid0571]|uniref:DUF1611 domain-containing protein n=1 Tax=Reichenbachiella sp. MALMAid0571 TaxID=3143939 RepID=UPI0032E052D8
MKTDAIILTNGRLQDIAAKTAHGLIRGTDRFQIRGVIDPPTCGRDAGEVLDGKFRDIPIFDSLEKALDTIGQVKYCIIGIATKGGILPEEMKPTIMGCLEKGISIVNGLHEFLSAKPEMVQLSEQYGTELLDIRKPKSRSELHFWSGEIYSVKSPIVAVLGMDCALGKRTTTRMIIEACAAHQLNAQMIYTGQTGWMQGGKYGFIFDSTLNDFIPGELEHAIVTCWKETQAEVILLEGQSGLRNPSGPCGGEFLVSGNARYTILVHDPKREYYSHHININKIPDVSDEIDLISRYGSEVIALVLNTANCSEEEAHRFQKQYADELQIPVLLPLYEGVNEIIPIIRQLISTDKK